MTVVDWRTLPAVEVARCYDLERAAWASCFHWDTSENWRHIEAARAAGSLTGFVAYEGQAATGWCFYLRHGETLQIGGLTGASSTVVGALVDRILAAPELAGASALLAFVPETSAAVQEPLRARGFTVRPFLYLTRELAEPTGTEGASRSFHAGRLGATADLLARAYPAVDPARPFAPGGTAGEWLEYTTQLLTQTGCGALLPWASVVDEDPERPGRLLGAVLTTCIASGTGHLAQVAVDVAHQQQGRGRRLVRSALARLQKRGFTLVSLLVAADNAPALALYTRLGFEPRGRFISACRRADVVTADRHAAC